MNKLTKISFSVIGLLLIFLFQKVSYVGWWNEIVPSAITIESSNLTFIINKTVRLVLNDALCMVLIWILFETKSYLKIAFILFLLEVGLILPVYFFFKLSLEGPTELSSPLLSQVHRMVVNPLLMFLLMAGFIYQRTLSGNNS